MLGREEAKASTEGAGDGTCGTTDGRDELSDDERDTLWRWARRHKSSQALALRSRIVLARAEGETNTAIAAELGCNMMEKIRDIVGLYLNPPVAAAVFAVDEKPQIQALNRSAPTLPMLPTTPVRGDHPAVGERVGGVHPVPDYDVEIRRVICSTNAIESLNARYRAG